MAMNKGVWERRTFWLVIAIIVFVVICGVVGLIETEEKTPTGAKTAPQEKVVKMTITCEPGKNPSDLDCDGVAECQTYHDCADGFACRRGQCEKVVVRIQCVPGRDEIDIDCDAVSDQIDNCPFMPNPDQANADKQFDDDIWLANFLQFGDACDPDRDSTHRVEVTFRPWYQQ